MNAESAWVEPLYTALQSRPRPEDVAKLALRLFPSPPHALRWRRRTLGRSYLPTEFERPTPLTHSANVLALLLGESPLDDAGSLGQPLDDLLSKAREAIAAPTGDLDFKAARRNREERAQAGLSLSRRRYNKLFRLTAFLEEERAASQRHQEFVTVLREAKTGLVRYIGREAFARDANTALFVTYLAARMGLRSEFTVAPQQRAFDDLGDAMLKTLESSATTEWMVVAYAFPRADVLARLSDDERVQLLGHAGNTMERAARILARVEGVDMAKGFVVRRGQDSSTWNAGAGAWNKARDFWLSLALELGIDVSGFLPGKVPRLIAADVAAWSRSIGRPPHPDEAVAPLLPPPWEALLEGVPCTEAMVRAACAQAGVDPDATGWTQPQARRTVETWRPTPELVHGVVVRSPEAALMMRRLGWYSGPAKWERENYGAKTE